MNADMGRPSYFSSVVISSYTLVSPLHAVGVVFVFHCYDMFTTSH